MAGSMFPKEGKDELRLCLVSGLRASVYPYMSEYLLLDDGYSCRENLTCASPDATSQPFRIFTPKSGTS